jgi:hypothetical protein
MTTVEALEQQIQKLNPKELAELREWFFEYEWDAWDRQLERDVQNGRLDKLGKKVLADHAAGRTKPAFEVS